MGDSTPSQSTQASPSEASAATHHIPQSVVVETPAQKRALSYSNTIHQLFTQVMDAKQPADRILADYFRSHKKHGSKDRRVIRESLFGLFRWHGWLKQLTTAYTAPQAWFASLALTAKIEDHRWQDISAAWQAFSTLTELKALDSIDELDSLHAKQQLLQRCFNQFSFAVTELAPEWYWRHSQQLTDNEQYALVDALSCRPPIWGRLQGISAANAIDKLSKLDIEAKMSEFFVDAINLGHKSINLNALGLYNQGELEIQDLGSQVIGNICAPKPNESWWDACSGAGGKTLQLRSHMLLQDKHSKGSILASDIRKRPLEELMKRAKRAKFKQITVAPWLSDALPVTGDHFDGVLVDAPCSCTGTWRRNPDMRWLDDEHAITDKPALQLDILSRASAAVRSGGTLVYATCSISPSENEAVVNAFLTNYPQFELQPLVHPFTGLTTTMLTVMPYQANSDGMFVAKMIKKPG
ncbi:RsmB/NOP family class I SAM-dependent RNA methyltransferase [Shewanella colwelliana]|uniref:RsmB/NOP family class I SAM-dependent RNA methyltransferase n=1 Tax=Shewanella colwelliana TaxID=23 RepID=UPI003D019320